LTNGNLSVEEQAITHYESNGKRVIFLFTIFRRKNKKTAFENVRNPHHLPFSLFFAILRAVEKGHFTFLRHFFPTKKSCHRKKVAGEEHQKADTCQFLFRQ
jgi:hypothetical protein